MTVKELESRTGMARANIRFYEGEGLLNPKRLDNGYRDYSEDDVRTLEKIRLLRQLQLDLDTIRKVQQGLLTLEQALFSHLTRLEGDKTVLERAAEVCRALERSGVEYGALDPQPWLQQLEALPAPEQEALPPPPVTPPEQDDIPRACRHPWQRFFARALDLNLYYAAFAVLWLVLLRDQTVVLAGGLVGWLRGLLLLMFTLAVEPVWLHYWGWTPGKWVFGLKLRDERGQKLTLSQGLERGCAVFGGGYGLNLPIYNLWRYWKCGKLGLEGKDCFWDGDNGYRYTKEERWFHGLVFTVAMALCAAAVITGVLYTQTPLHQGGLTVEQFSENYNYYLKQLEKQDVTGLPILSGDGRWVERYLPDDGIYLLSGAVWSDPSFTLDGDRVVAVELHMESEDAIVGLFDGGIREQLALLAMTGALDGLNLFNYDINGWLTAYGDRASAWQDFEFAYRGLRVSQQVEYSGYTNAGNELIQTDGSTPCHVEKTLTVSLAE